MSKLKVKIRLGQLPKSFNLQRYSYMISQSETYSVYNTRNGLDHLALAQMKATSAFRLAASRTLTATAPVTKAPIPTLPDQMEYSLLFPVFATFRLSKITTLGLNVPCCGTGAWIWTLGAFPDETATVKLTTVVDVELSDVRQGTTKLLP
jgi:hypothetical protein